MADGVFPALCRTCINTCSVLVTVEGGRPVRVVGDKDSPLYGGYSCQKGRRMPQEHNDPHRLRRPLARSASGELTPVSLDDVLDDIAARLRHVLAETGPTAVAGYFGTRHISNPTTAAFFGAFMDAIGSPMRFNPNTIDKPGKTIAKALHGSWSAPVSGFAHPDAVLVLGANPLVTYTGFPAGNPRRWLRDQLARGMRLVVIDPRRSDVARRATTFIQPRPGHDAELLASMLRVIVEEGRYDAAFVGENATGLDRLRAHLRAFVPALVADRAGVDADDIVRAARVMAGTRRGYTFAGTGPNMSGHGTLVEYLILCLTTLCGHWARAGDRVDNPGVLAATPEPVAQPVGARPASGFGHRLRVRGLSQSAAGMPTAALADEILLPGKGRIRALISCGGNPAVAFPDQVKTLAALRSLDLLVQIDPWLSETSKLATHVIPPKMALETYGSTMWTDALTFFGTGYGMGVPFAQFVSPVVEPPDGSQLVEEWEFFYGLARRMGLRLRVSSPTGLSALGGAARPTDAALEIDMRDPPDPETVHAMVCSAPRVSIQEVRRHPHGAVFPEPASIVQPRRHDCCEFLVLDAAEMMDALDRLLSTSTSPTPARGTFRLICRREDHSYNTSAHVPHPDPSRGYNPALLNPADLDSLGLAEGDEVRLISRHGHIPAILGADPTLRRGVVSMAFGYGGRPEADGDHRQTGSPPSRLLSVEDMFDPHSGQPRMSDVEVRIEPLTGGQPGPGWRC